MNIDAYIISQNSWYISHGRTEKNPQQSNGKHGLIKSV